jgi:hypothetical protein
MGQIRPFHFGRQQSAKNGRSPSSWTVRCSFNSKHQLPGRIESIDPYPSVTNFTVEEEDSRNSETSN